MRDVYFDLRLELEITKKELEARLIRENNKMYSTEISSEFVTSRHDLEKRNSLLHNIREDLCDVKRALAKMEVGVFGICEDTGVSIPMKQLRVIPTARTIYDFYLLQK